MKTLTVVSFLLPVLFFSACKKASSEPPDNNTGDNNTLEIPAWIEDLIEVYESGADPNPSIQITLLQLADGNNYFYFISPCCDQLNPLYDYEGNLVCHPDGGFSGGGDGQCPDYVINPVDSRVIWELPAPSP